MASTVDPGWKYSREMNVVAHELLEWYDFISHHVRNREKLAVCYLSKGLSPFQLAGLLIIYSAIR